MAKPYDLAHFAIQADDCERARHFYEQVFGWHFLAWGEPGRWMIRTSLHAPIYGTLQPRETPAARGGLRGFECTIAVENVDTLAERIAAAGGRVVAPATLVEGVGTVLRFEDSEGNPVCAMRYESHRH